MKVSAPFQIQLSRGRSAKALRAEPDADTAEVARALGLAEPRGLLMLAGGAGDMEDDQFRMLGPLMQQAGEAVSAAGAMVIDGGTDAGVMALMGSALARAHETVEHIGVLPAKAQSVSGRRAEDMLEPHHTCFVLVESDRWGGETALMYRLAELLSHKAPSVAVLVNGGQIALDEVEWNVRQARDVIVLRGSGRLADDLAAAANDPNDRTPERLRSIVREGILTFLDVAAPPGELKGAILRGLKAV